MNDSERKDYMKVYNKSYKKQKDSIVEYRYSYFDLNVQPTDINFKGTDEAAICAQFGCGKKLTSIESLAGNKCIHCMGKHKTIIHG